jgi:hypothetical protein
MYVHHHHNIYLAWNLSQARSPVAGEEGREMKNTYHIKKHVL